MKKRMLLAAIAALLFCPMPAAAQTGPPPFVIPPGLPIPQGTRVRMIPAVDIADLKKALQTATVVYSIKPPSQMPDNAKIATYDGPGDDTAYAAPHIVISADYAKLAETNELKSASRQAREQLSSAVVMYLAATGAAGPNFGFQFGLTAGIEHDCQKCNDKHYASRMFATNFANEVLGDRSFDFAPHFTLAEPADLNTQDALIRAVVQQLSPGSNVDSVRKTPSEMPGWDAIAHYAGIGAEKNYGPKDAVVYLNAEKFSTSAASPLDADSLEQYYEALVMATCDLGFAGPQWKARYDVAAAADAAIASNEFNRYKNRHLFAAPVATKLLALAMSSAH